MVELHKPKLGNLKYFFWVVGGVWSLIRNKKNKFSL
jgi:hypothetical protein